MYETWKPNFLFVKKRIIIAHTDPQGKNLYITKDKFPWDDIMYAMMYYMMYQDKIVCPYCGHTIKVSQLTIDHKYPRHYGGISIISNLELCCRKCNSIKGDLNKKEFEQVMEIVDEMERKAAIVQILKEKEKKRFQSFLPQDWITSMGIHEICMRKNYHDLNFEGKINYNSYVSEFKRVKRPIIVDKNKVILDGLPWYLAAKKNGLTHIDTVFLENCIWK